jgi:CBS domain containing-hemolysin-like protein
LITLLVLLFLVIGAVAFYAGSETAYICTTRYRLANLEKTSGKLGKFLARSELVLATTLVGTNLFYVLASLILVEIINRYVDPNYVALVSTVILTPLLMLFGEILPKAYTRYNSAQKVKSAGLLIQISYYLYYPLVVISNGVYNMLRTKNDNGTFSRNDLKVLFYKSGWIKDFGKNEKRAMQAILDFSSRRVREIMVPRTKITGLDHELSIDEAFSIAAESAYSRFPIYEDNLDNIIGFLHVRDLFKFKEIGIGLLKEAELRDMLFIPESRNQVDALNDLRAHKTNLAIIIDEHSGTDGLITIEDLLEEFIGDVVDEHDDEVNHFEKVNARMYFLSGELELRELEHRLNIEIPCSENYNTVAGLLLDLHDRVPEEDEVLFYDNLEFKIIRKRRQKLERILLRVKPKSESIITN